MAEETKPAVEVQPEPLIDISDAFDADAEESSDFADELAEAPAKAQPAVAVKPEAKSAEPIVLDGEVKPSKPETKTKYKLKIKGVEEEVDLTPTELTAWLQKAKHSDQRYSEAAEIEKQSRKLFALFKENPYEALRAMGHDPEKLAEELVYTKAKRSLMSADERAQVSLQDELVELRRKDAEHQAQSRQGEVAKLQETIEKEIADVLTKEGLPNARELRRTIVRYMMEADAAGHEVTAAEVFPYALADYKASMSELFGGLSMEKMIDIMGEDVAAKIRKHGVERAKKAFTNQVSRDRQAAPAAQKEKAPRFYSTEDFLDSL